MPVVITLIIAIFLILISWTWHNLGSIETPKKVFIIISLIIICFVITIIVFNISKKDITYDLQEEMEAVRNVLVTLFTFINGIIIMPSIAKTINGVREKEIEKTQAKKRLVIAFVIFIIVLIVECGYLKDIQQGILNIYEMKK